MQIVRDSEKTAHQSENSVVHEYDTVDKDIGGATATINGRYPAEGYIVNLRVKQLVSVLSGNGEIILTDEKREIGQGDIIFIDRGEKFAWNGQLSLFIANAPRFDPAQYRETA